MNASPSAPMRRCTPVRRAFAFLLIALGLGLPVLRGLHDASPAHRMEAAGVRAACPDGCTEPGHHHEGHDDCAFCSSHAPVAVRASITKLEAPAGIAFVSRTALARPALSCRRSACVPRGPPVLLVA